MYEYIDGNKYMITLTQNTREWKVPDWATYVVCENMGLEHIELHENVEVLYAENNLLSELHIPAGIKCLDVKNNLIAKITSDGPLTELFSFDIRNNRLSNLELEIPNPVDSAYILGNRGLRIENPEWLFVNDRLVTTDVSEEMIRWDKGDLCIKRSVL